MPVRGNRQLAAPTEGIMVEADRISEHFGQVRPGFGEHRRRERDGDAHARTQADGAGMAESAMAGSALPSFLIGTANSSR